MPEGTGKCIYEYGGEAGEAGGHSHDGPRPTHGGGLVQGRDNISVLSCEIARRRRTQERNFVLRTLRRCGGTLVCAYEEERGGACHFLHIPPPPGAVARQPTDNSK
jgi:hypothetical protein